MTSLILYTPVVAGLVIATATAQFWPIIDGGWSTLILGYLGIGSLVAGTVWVVGLITPGRQQRSSDLRAALGPLFRLARRSA